MSPDAGRLAWERWTRLASHAPHGLRASALRLASLPRPIGTVCDEALVQLAVASTPHALTCLKRSPWPCMLDAAGRLFVAWCARRFGPTGRGFTDMGRPPGEGPSRALQAINL